MMSNLESFFKPCVFGFSSKALSTILIVSSRSNGLGIYSNAPPPNDSTADCISEKAVIIMTGNPSKLLLMCFRRSKPNIPGI